MCLASASRTSCGERSARVSVVGVMLPHPFGPLGRRAYKDNTDRAFESATGQPSAGPEPQPARDSARLFRGVAPVLSALLGLVERLVRRLEQLVLLLFDGGAERRVRAHGRNAQRRRDRSLQAEGGA